MYDSPNQSMDDKFLIQRISIIFQEVSPSGICRNPSLAKCGGEAQHLEKLGIWSPPGLPNV
jgi:hypothetical protein